MVQMKDVFCILKTDSAESDSVVDNINFNEQIICTDSLINMDSFWRFQKSSTQRMMIFLPSNIYYVYQQTKNECFNRLKERVPYIDKIFEYECIDIVIYGNDHFS